MAVKDPANIGFILKDVCRLSCVCPSTEARSIAQKHSKQTKEGQMVDVRTGANTTRDESLSCQGMYAPRAAPSNVGGAGDSTCALSAPWGLFHHDPLHVAHHALAIRTARQQPAGEEPGWRRERRAENLCTQNRPKFGQNAIFDTF